MTTTVTPSLLRSWSCCWDGARIARYFGTRKQIDVRVIAADESISLDDRLWVATRLIAHLDEHAARRYAVECALSVAHLAGDEDDEAQFRAICNRLIEIGDLPPSSQAAARAAARAAACDAALRDSLARALEWLP